MSLYFVDGVDNSVEGIESVRNALIGHRDQAMSVWPEGIEYSTLLSHAIAMLAELEEYKKAGVEIPK